MQAFPTFNRHIMLLAPLAFMAGVASAQIYPTKSIEWVVPYPAGGGSDVVARSLTEPMGKALGQPLIINNKPGAATNIGADYVAHAKADGYTLLTGDTATLAANPALYGKLNYSAEKRPGPGRFAGAFSDDSGRQPGYSGKELC